MMEMRGNKTSHFPISSQRKKTRPSVVLHQLLWELGRTVIHSTVIAHQLRSVVSLTLMISAAQKTINSKTAVNWQNVNLNGNGSEREWE